jgi:ERF superfamily
MQTSEQIDFISTALAKAQAELQNPPKNKTNPHFNSKYVDLSDGLDVIRKTLSKHDIAFVQAPASYDNILILHTRLMHKSGQWLESTYPVSGLEKHQAMGSALTYARRYSLFAMVGVAGEDDDDGNAAQEAKPVAKAAKKQMQPGLSPEDSEKLYKVLAGTLNEFVKDMDQLREWATENQDKKVMLLPEHQRLITEHFKEVQKKLSKA